MRTRWYLPIALGWLAFLNSVSVYAQQPVQPPPIPTLYGFPLWLRDLTDLTPIIYRKDVTPLQKTEVLLTWLSEERNSPSPPSTGLGGGRIDSSYIQQQLIISLGVDSDTESLMWLVSSGRISDKDILDALHIALAMKGDTSEVPTMIRILKTHPNGDYRSLAVGAIHILYAKDAIPALQQALKDEFSTRAGKHGSTFTSYPVRERAAETLKAFQQFPESVAARSSTRIQKFATESKDHKQYAIDNKVMLERLLTAANLSGKSRPANPAPKSGNQPGP